MALPRPNPASGSAVPRGTASDLPGGMSSGGQGTSGVPSASGISPISPALSPLRVPEEEMEVAEDFLYIDGSDEPDERSPWCVAVLAQSPGGELQYLGGFGGTDGNGP